MVRWTREKRQFLDRASCREKETSSQEPTKETIDKMVDTTTGQEKSTITALAKSKPAETQHPAHPKKKTKTTPLHPSSSITFTLKSGILLWGQLPTLFAASLTPDFQTDASSTPPMLPGGTIKQYVPKYRSAARNGDWKVRRVFDLPYPGNGGDAARHFE